MRQRHPSHTAGYYRCRACGQIIERAAEPGKPLKRWRKSHCTITGRDVRIWLQITHTMPQQDSGH